MAGVASGMITHSQVRSAAARTLQAERLFYVIAGSVMLIATVVGFRAFIAHGKGFAGDITRQIVPLVVVHGLAMFSWIVLFPAQSVLVWRGNRRLHMRIGVAGAVLAGVMVVLGTTTASLSAKNNPAPYQFLGGARFFLATMVGEMLCFGAFVATAVIYRRRLEIHRPMMLMASLMIISGSLSRCPYIENFAIKPPLYVLGPALVFGALCFVLQWAMTRTVNRWYALGYLGFVAASVMFIVVGHSSLWNQIAGAIVG